MGERLRVAGVSFCPGYPNNLLDLTERLAYDPISVDLVRDVDNAYDMNAVEVQLEGRKLGMLPAPVAARRPGLEVEIAPGARVARRV